MKNAEMNIVRFQTDDIMTTSGGGVSGLSIREQTAENFKYYCGPGIGDDSEAEIFASTHIVITRQLDNGMYEYAFMDTDYSEGSDYRDYLYFVGWYDNINFVIADYKGPGIYLNSGPGGLNLSFCDSTEHWHPNFN